MNTPLRMLAFLVSGILFALGLGIGGMTLPENVVGFLDVTGDWKPQLAFVMGGALVTYAIAYNVAKRFMTRPVLEERFQIPTRRDIEPRLLGGAALFGAGWGLAGFCPGPGLVAVVSGSTDAILFVVAMLGGMVLWNVLEAVRNGQGVKAAFGLGGR